MRRLLAALRFIDRYVTLAGRSCCVGRSQIGLQKSLDRRTKQSS